MINKTLAAIFFLFVSCAVFSGQVTCPNLKKTPIENELAQLVGYAVLYPMDEVVMTETVSCLFDMYTDQTKVLGGARWDVTHALLRIMSAAPAEFFEIVSKQNANAVNKWMASFENAALWPREHCPKFDPISIAWRSIEGINLADLKQEKLRRQIVSQAKKWPCRVAD
jgi:hypothetical protein